MKRVFGVLTAMLALGTVACGNNDCEDAADKIVDECDITGFEEDEDETAECSAAAECFAKCVNDASCSEIRAFYEDLTTQNSFTACAAECV